MHDDPAQPWTVASLAAAAKVSRAALARRFSELVGVPPMTYLPNGGWPSPPTCCANRETISSVARKVGYGTPSPSSTAFKRIRGISPHQHRMTTLSA